MITPSRPKTLCNFWIFPLTVLVLFMQGCATTKLTSVDPLAYKGQGRTKSIINEDVTVTVAVPTIAEKAPAEVTRPVDPHVNEARYDLAQDLAYSQALIKIGFIKGSGRRQSAAAEKASEDIHYTTDGLRVVLVFGDRPASLDKIEFFDWERLADYR